MVSVDCPRDSGVIRPGSTHTYVKERLLLRVANKPRKITCKMFGCKLHPSGERMPSVSQYLWFECSRCGNEYFWNEAGKVPSSRPHIDTVKYTKNELICKDLIE